MHRNHLLEFFLTTFSAPSLCEPREQCTTRLQSAVRVVESATTTVGDCLAAFRSRIERTRVSVEREVRVVILLPDAYGPGFSTLTFKGAVSTPTVHSFHDFRKSYHRCDHRSA